MASRFVYPCGCASCGDVLYQCPEHSGINGDVMGCDDDVNRDSWKQHSLSYDDDEAIDLVKHTCAGGLWPVECLACKDLNNFRSRKSYKANQIDSTVGIGGAPTRATSIPEEASERKKFPVASGVMEYFPDALVAVANVSWQGNEQHNPGQPLHWARGKSTDEADAMIRHFLQRGTKDKDGIRHTAKMVWRALAMLQKEIEQERSSNET